MSSTKNDVPVSSSTKPSLLLTGGLGFLGSRFLSMYSSQFSHVYVLDNGSAQASSSSSAVRTKAASGPSNVHYVHADITDLASFSPLLPERLDMCLHFAAAISVQESMTNPEKYFRCNVEGSKNVFSWAAEHGVRSLVATSSAAIYGNPPSGPIKESTPYGGVSPYADSKYRMELAAAEMFPTYESSSMRINFVRPFNIYGPGQKPGGYAGFITAALSRASRGQNIIVYGTGKQTRDFVYVDDVCTACYKLLHTTRSKHLQSFNIGTGRSIEIGELGRKIASMVSSSIGKSIDVDFEPAREGDVLFSESDVSALKGATDWEPSLTLEEGLSRTWTWFRSEHATTA